MPGCGRIEVVVVRLVFGARAGSAGSAAPRRSRAASRAARRCAARGARRPGTRRGSKNMPSLVRAALTSLAPVGVSTVSERARRARASAISSSHSSAESRSPKTTTRGLRIAMTTRDVAVAGADATAAPASMRRLGHRPARRRAAAAASPCRPRWPRSVVSSAAIGGVLVPAARLHRVEDDLGRMAGRRLGDDPSRSSAVIGCAVMRRFCRTASAAAGMPASNALADRARRSQRKSRLRLTSPCSSGEWSISFAATQVHHRVVALALALPLAVDGEQRRAEQRLPLRLGDPRPDDDVDRAGLVLEGDEDRALGGLGALPVRDEAARARQAAVREACAARAAGSIRNAASCGAQQRERMALQASGRARGSRRASPRPRSARRARPPPRATRVSRSISVGRVSMPATAHAAWWRWPVRPCSASASASAGQRVRVEAGAPRQVFGGRRTAPRRARRRCAAGVLGRGPLMRLRPRRTAGAARRPSAERADACRAMPPAPRSLRLRACSPIALTATSTGRTSTPCSRASRTSCAGA